MDEINESKAFVHIEAIIQSMTPAEREKPSIIDPKRKRRIAAGSGTKVEDVNRLLRQFEQMSKMMKQLKKTRKSSGAAVLAGCSACKRWFRPLVDAINSLAVPWAAQYKNTGGDSMAVKIRLRRMGAKKAPFYRIVVADSRYPRDGRFIEEVGYYDPTKDPVVVKIDEEKAKKWIANGAQPTDTVKAMLKANGVI